MKILFVFGTRPEILKLAPVISAARKDTRFSARICFTGQHREMAYQVLDLFKIKPQHDLRVMRPNQSLSLLTERLMKKLNNVLLLEKPDAVVVQGDTTSAFVGALAAFYHKIPVAHVEAGLRSFDKYQPFPEELNRAFISRIADWHLTPTRDAARNLLRENTAKKTIHVTGNTVVDALAAVKSKISANELPLIKRLRKQDKRIILATMHRRENFGKPMEQICRAFVKLTEQYPDVEFLVLVHKNPHVQETVHRILKGRSSIHLLPPANYLEFLAMMNAAYLIISDSGGVQEEAPSLRRPVLVLRNVTERPEGIFSGVAKLVGTDSKKIFGEATKLLDQPKVYRRMVSGKNPYGDGRASKRILNILARGL